MPRHLARAGWLVPLVLWVVVLLLPSTGFTLLSERDIILIAVYCLVTAGINLSFGYGGELALGQVAVMAAGAYVSLILGDHGITSIGVQVIVAAAAGALLGLVTGLPGLRLSKWSLGLTSFFLIMLLPGAVVALRELTGGLEGRLVPQVTLFGEPVQVDTLYVVVIVIVGVWLAIFRNLILSGYGAALRSFRANPMLVESLGVSARTMRLSSYVVGAVPAAVAGVLYAQLAGYLSPAPFSLAMLLAVLAASVFGGSDSVYGPVIGALVLVMGPAQIEAFEEYSVLVYGVFLLIVGGLFRHGVAGYARISLTSRLCWSPPATTAPGPLSPMTSLT
jgi:branched-chain amino acid transport system permease protein